MAERLRSSGAACRHGALSPEECSRCADAAADRALEALAEQEGHRKTRKQQLLEAFRVAGSRGLTGLEMQAAVGVFWRLRLGELREDGCAFLEHPSRIKRADGSSPTFRWTLVLEPGPAADTDDDALFDPPVPPPGNAIFGEPS